MGKRYFMTIIFLFISFLCFSADKNKSLEEKKKAFGEFTQGAINYAVEGDFEKAYQEFKYALEINKTQLVEKQLKFLEDILNGKIKKDVGIHFFKGLHSYTYGYHDPDKLNEAVTEFKSVTNEEPTCELAHYFFADACYHSSCVHTEEGENILPAYKKAIEIDPNFALAHLWLAAAYCFLERSSDAITKCELAVEHYDRAITLKPSLKNLPASLGEPSIEGFIGACRKVLKGEIPGIKYEQ